MCRSNEEIDTTRRAIRETVLTAADFNADADADLSSGSTAGNGSLIEIQGDKG